MTTVGPTLTGCLYQLVASGEIESKMTSCTLGTWHETARDSKRKFATTLSSGQLISPKLGELKSKSGYTISLKNPLAGTRYLTYLARDLYIDVKLNADDCRSCLSLECDDLLLDMSPRDMTQLFKQVSVLTGAGQVAFKLDGTLLYIWQLLYGGQTHPSASSRSTNMITKNRAVFRLPSMLFPPECLLEVQIEINAAAAGHSLCRERLHPVRQRLLDAVSLHTQFSADVTSVIAKYLVLQRCSEVLEYMSSPFRTVDTRLEDQCLAPVSLRLQADVAIADDNNVGTADSKTEEKRQIFAPAMVALRRTMQFRPNSSDVQVVDLDLCADPYIANAVPMLQQVLIVFRSPGNGQLLHGPRLNKTCLMLNNSCRIDSDGFTALVTDKVRHRIPIGAAQDPPIYTMTLVHPEHASLNEQVNCAVNLQRFDHANVVVELDALNNDAATSEDVELTVYLIGKNLVAGSSVLSRPAIHPRGGMLRLG